MGEVTRATRRSGAEVRTAVLAAASAEFARVGYSGARLKDIASLAGTSESGLARHFATKEELFSAAVLDPFHGLLDAYGAAFDRMIDRPEPDREFFEAFIRELYDQVDNHRDSVRALILAGEDPEAQAAVQAAADRMLQLFSSIHGLTEKFYARYEKQTVETSRLWPGMAAGLIVAITALERFFVPQGDSRPGRDELITAVTDLWSRGIMGDSLPD